MKTLLLTLAFTGAAFAQNVTAKAEPAKATTPQAAPTLSTAKYWRLLSDAKDAHKTADETPQGKAAADADIAVQAAIQELVRACGADFVVSLDQDKNSPTYKDVICMAKPPAEASKPADAKK